MKRCPVPVPCFLCYFYCRKLLLEIFSELDKNLRRFFVGQIRTGARRAGPADVQKDPRGSHPRVTGGPRPGVASAPRAPPRDALWPINHPRRENPNPRWIFPNMIQSSAVITNQFRGFRRSCFGTLPGRGSSTGAISINTAASRDEEGAVPHRG